MKKVDLHIHTVATPSDVDFNFSMQTLLNYIEEMSLDAIAITNHNYFDYEQYVEICSNLSNIAVFPGIEISIGENCGHLLLIADSAKALKFKDSCKLVTEAITNGARSIAVEDLEEFFGNLGQYLLIPHYYKEPAVDKNILNILKANITCVEVSSPKKFVQCRKEGEYRPVCFSDFRCKEGVEHFPIKQSYLNIGEISIASIKLCLKDCDKVMLSDDDNKTLFTAAPNIVISTGLNIVLGERSSGKTYTLELIKRYNENVKYVKQFSLLETTNEKGKEFEEKITAKQKGDIRKYFSEFADVVGDIKNIDLEKDNNELDEYIYSLIKNAKEVELKDVFSNCSLFSEIGYDISSLNNLKQIIASVETILDSQDYKEIIDENVGIENLKRLHRKLIEQFEVEKALNDKKEWINDLVSNIKTQLQSRTASTRIKDIDLYKIQMDRKKVEIFECIANNIKNTKEIFNQSIGTFTVKAVSSSYIKAQELKNHSGSKLSFLEAYSSYDEPYEFLNKLKSIVGLDESTYHEYFAKIQYGIYNEYGLEVSGGERAELNLLQEIERAYQYDMLIIDEPESSFDNLFLKNQVNKMLKDISKKLPVVIVTHNNTVGASINPDYIIYTERCIENREIKFYRYFGFPTDKTLVDSSGHSRENVDILLDCLEAGEDAYNERGENYEILKNK